MNKKKLFKISLALLSISVIGYNCGGGGSSSSGSSGDTVGISGSFGSDYSYNQKNIFDFLIPKAFASYGSVKRVIAIPIMGNFIDINFVQIVNVNSDGSFNLNLKKTFTYGGKSYKTNWILLIEKTNGDFEFIGIADNNDSLISWPIGDITTARIDLGIINRSGNDEATGDLDLTEFSQYTDLDIETLEKFIKLDDIVKSIINMYVNNYGKTENEYIFPQLHVVSSGDYISFRNNYSIAQNFQGYAFHIHSGSLNTVSKNFQNICNNNAILRLYPSGNIVANNITYNQNNPLQSQGSSIQNRTDGGKECGTGIFYIRKDSNGDTVVNFIVGDTSSVLAKTKPIPAGWFYLKLNNLNIAKFKFSYSLPLTKDNNHLKVPTPAVKLDVENDGRVVGAYVKWYVYNEGTSQYEDVDPKNLQWLISEYSIHMDDFNGISGNTNRLEIACDNISITKNYVNFSTDCKNYADIYYNYNGEDKYSLDDFNLSINIFDNGYRFTYRKP